MDPTAISQTATPNSAQWLQAGAAAVTCVVAAVAAAIALRQLFNARGAHKVERTLAAHRDLTTGEVGGCRDRFTSFMWGYGTQFHGRNQCWTPDFDALNPDRQHESSSASTLIAYPDWVLGGRDEEPLRDLYKVLWSFERIDTARRRKTLHNRMLRELVGPHAAWWNSLLRNILPSDTRHRSSLDNLGAWAVDKQPKLLAWANHDFDVGTPLVD